MKYGFFQTYFEVLMSLEEEGGGLHDLAGKPQTFHITQMTAAESDSVFFNPKKSIPNTTIPESFL